MVTDQQVRRLRQKLMEGKTQEAAAVAAGMSVRTARTWQRGLLPSEQKGPRIWRTRPDPIAAVWSEGIEPLLQRDPAGALQATTILEWLEQQYPGRFGPAQLRTLQRRVRDWRALHGPEQEVFFPQEHPPGREAQVDFTHGKELGITIAGQPFPHLFFELVLSYSGWRFVDLAFGETFEALRKGIQDALWALGGVPEVVRSDNLSAATHELKETKGRTLNQQYAALLEHYGLRSTRTNRGASHENGVVEQAHYRLKSAITQALLLRGSRDFSSVAAYRSFVQEVVQKRNQGSQAKLAEEQRRLRPLPPAPVPEYTTYRTRVMKWGTIRVTHKTYSVPSRLQGHEVEVRQYTDHLEVYCQGHLTAQLARLHGEQSARIDYRHIIWSLMRKPGAFARYRFREHLPIQLQQQLQDLAQGDFVDRNVSVLAFGLPGTGKTHALCAIGHRLVEAGRSVLFMPAYRLVQELLAAKRDLQLPRALRKLDSFGFLLIDDLGYLPQGAEESEVLFTLVAERYERRALGITSNLVFSQWGQVFQNPMATAAAIDRVVHHSIILEFDVSSYRTDEARGKQQQVAGGANGGKEEKE